MNRLLIVSTTFFPDPMVGSVRMSQWCRHLPEFGWAPRVLCRNYGYEATPEMIAKMVHPDVTLRYLNTFDGNQRNSPQFDGTARGSNRSWLRRTAGQIAREFAVPDSSIFFWRRAYERAFKLAQEYKPHVLLSTSPTNATHWLGLRLSTALNIPWVVDFRDPYIIDARFQPQSLGWLVLEKHRRFERQLYANAALIIHAIPTQFRWASRQYPADAYKMHVIENGVPVSLLEQIASLRGTQKTERLSIRTIGAIDNQDMLKLARAVRLLVDRGKNVELRIVGATPESAGEASTLLGDRFIATGYLRHDEAIHQIVTADVLVSFLSSTRSHYFQLSSKLFEFLATDRPIIEINPSQPDRLFLRNRTGVLILKAPTEQQLAESLVQSLALPPRPQAEIDQYTHHFSRKEQTHKLATLLDQIAVPKQLVAISSTAESASTSFAPTSSVPKASVVIPTFNRKKWLREAIISAQNQTITPEIVVVDDGSTDGTLEMMSTEFPHVKYKRLNGPFGPSLLRTLGCQIARGEFVFPIDDDAIMVSPRIIEQTLADFSHPRIAAVGIPFINVNTDKKLQQRAPDDGKIHLVHAYIGCAHALRRDVFLSVGGYRKELFYMGEEGDVCLRMLNHGYITCFGRSEPIHHQESASRSFWRADMYGRRNDILFAWQNAPLSFVPKYWARATVGGMLHGYRVGRLSTMAKGSIWGYLSVLQYASSREPVHPDIFKLFQRLKRESALGQLTLEEIESQLPAVQPAQTLQPAS